VVVSKWFQGIDEETFERDWLWWTNRQRNLEVEGTVTREYISSIFSQFNTDVRVEKKLKREDGGDLPYNNILFHPEMNREKFFSNCFSPQKMSK